MAEELAFSLDKQEAARPRGRVCPQCSYERKPTDTAPAWQCPRCQVVYDKALSGGAAQRAADRAEQAAVRRAEPSGWWRWGVLALVMAGAGGAAWQWRGSFPSAAERAQAVERTARIGAIAQDLDEEAQLEAARTQLRMGKPAEAFATFTRLANRGNTRAMVHLALMHGDGQGVPRDPAQKMAWLRKAAAEGSALAFVHLGYLYEMGIGEPRNHEQAVNWYEKAARQGDGAGLYALGALHARGVPGMPANLPLAYFLLELSSREFTRNPGHDGPIPGGRTAFWAPGLMREIQPRMSPVEVVKAREQADAWRPGQPFPK